ncbi:MAG: glycine dehydrogenase subunit 2 [Candidatus Methanomethylophilaceae archaeon]|nr:glycine dehydrogenase subunit 2 [Candidatus Methanomethylophilaceae archaeon]
MPRPRLIMDRPSDEGYPDVEGYVPIGMERKKMHLPKVDEPELIRHYIGLSRDNFGTDNGPYPLGSCTMKHNPKYADRLASLPEVTRMHPWMDDGYTQGCLEIMHRMEMALRCISGMDAISLQPSAGAHGEYTSMLMVRAYHSSRNEERDEVIVPDSAHGTNPASAAMAGFKVVEVPSAEDGCVDLGALEAALCPRTAALMLTNPNTLGIFERRVKELAEMVHSCGALLYYDGANLNAIMGRSNPAAMGFDMVHFNLHKTFATPHGGGGPGSGPVGVRSFLEPFLPIPRIAYDGETFTLDWAHPQSIGKVSSNLGNFAVILRAYAYILRQGGDGLKGCSERAVLNANYLKHRIEKYYDVPFSDPRKHEFVASAARLKKEKGIRALDVAKRMIDYNIHPPTIYFPSLVEEALMIEPTEDESLESLERIADALITIAHEDPAVVLAAPENTPVGRVDEAKAAKDAILSYRRLHAIRGV